MKNKRIYRIEFKETLFDAIICLNSTLPNKGIFGKLTGIPILAADGAATRLYNSGIEPDFIIGDFDSVKIKPEILNTFKNKLIYDPSQEINDFEKTLQFALKQNYSNILLFGFHGGLLEHTLNNWSVLMRLSKLVNICLYERKRYAIPVNRSININLKYNEIVSLLPQPETVITTENLKWQLKSESLKLGMREGARNQAIDPKVTIILNKGSYLLFIDDRLPFIPAFI